MSNEKKKAELNLTGPSKGGPSLDDLTALFRGLTGREPSEQDLAEARAVLESIPKDAVKK